MRSLFRGLRQGLNGANVACFGALLFVILTAGAILGLLAVVWWGLREYL
jgi:hypothetical protein